MFFNYFGISSLILLSIPLNAQQRSIDKLGSLLSITGQFSFHQSFNYRSGLAAVRAPYQYIAQGGIQIQLGKWAIPLQVQYANAAFTYQQPFNQLGLSPHYKWITLHGGYRSVQLNTYLLPSTTYLGGAIELTPGKWHVLAVYGRFRKAMPMDTLTLPQYDRWGGGYKIAFRGSKTQWEQAMLLFKDDTTSHPSDSIPAQASLGYSIGIQHKLSTAFQFSVEWAILHYQHNFKSSELEELSKSFPQLFIQSASLHQARKIQWRYNQKKVGIALVWERIDPGFTSLGAYYFMNDIEKWSCQTKVSIPAIGGQVSTELGWQRTNLKQTMGTATSSFLYQVQAAVKIKKKLQLQTTFSNATYYTRLIQRFQTLRLTDTLQMIQVNRAAQVSIQWIMGPSSSCKRLQFQYSWQQLVSTTGALNSVWTSNLQYQHSGKNQRSTIQCGIQSTSMPHLSTTLYALGPFISYRWLSASKRWTVSASGTFQGIVDQRSLQGKLSSTQIQLQYSPTPPHRFQLSGTQIIAPVSSSDGVYTDWTFQCNYAYQF